jgi:hypothetical protein
LTGIDIVPGHSVWPFSCSNDDIWRELYNPPVIKWKMLVKVNFPILRGVLDFCPVFGGRNEIVLWEFVWPNSVVVVQLTDLKWKNHCKTAAPAFVWLVDKSVFKWKACTETVKSRVSRMAIGILITTTRSSFPFVATDDIWRFNYTIDHNTPVIIRAKYPKKW